LSATVAELAAADKLRFLDLSWDPTVAYTFWAGLLGGAVLTMATHGTDQMFVQRLLACGNVGAARRAVIGSGFLVFGQMALFLLLGALLSVFYVAVPPDPALASADQAFPRFIADHMPPGLAGLVIAAVFAAAMSTLSSSMSSLASASTLDFWLRGAGRGDVGAELSLRISRASTFGWAVVLALVAGLAQAWGSVLEAGLTITSITFGGVLGIFLVAALGVAAERQCCGRRTARRRTGGSRRPADDHAGVDVADSARRDHHDRHRRGRPPPGPGP